jgi:phenylacetate-CoA ligase
MKDAFLTFIGIILYHIKYKKFPKKSNYFIRKYQFRKLRKLLITCLDVPYYKELFYNINFNPKIDFRNLSDIEKIPILTKEIVRTNPELFINQRYLKKSLIFKTSGTTGAPFISYVSYKHWIVEQAVIWRHWKWAGYRLFNPIAIIRSHNPKSETDIIKEDKIRRWTYYSPYHLNDKWMEIFYQDILKKKTKFLRGYPSSLSLFAEFCLKNGYSIPTLKGCLTASEVLSSKERIVIEDAFKVKVYDHYGLAEAIVMLHNNGQKETYFNCEEYGFLELIKTDIKGEYEIIGTNLNNYSMPLIRYNTEDIAEASISNSEVLIKNVIGRKDVYIETETVLIPTVNLYTLLCKVDGIIQWQIIQNDKKTLDIYLKVKPDHNIEIIKKKIDTLNKTGLIFKYHQTTVFSLVGEGKLKPFISNI